MKAYVTRDNTGAVKEGWLLRNGTPVTAIMCRSQRTPIGQPVEEVDTEEVLHGAALCRHPDCEICGEIEEDTIKHGG